MWTRASLEMKVKKLIARLAGGGLDEELPKIFVVVQDIQQFHLQPWQHLHQLFHLEQP